MPAEEAWSTVKRTKNHKKKGDKPAAGVKTATTQWALLTEDDPDAARAKSEHQRVAAISAEKNAKHVAWKSKAGAKKKPKADKLQPLNELAKQLDQATVKEWLTQAASVSSLGDLNVYQTIQAALENSFFGCDCRWIGQISSGAPLTTVKELKKVTEQSVAMLTKALRKLDKAVVTAAMAACASTLLEAMAQHRSDVIPTQGSTVTGAAIMLQLSLAAAPTALRTGELLSVSRRGGAAGKWQPSGLKLAIYQLRAVEHHPEHAASLWTNMLHLMIEKAVPKDANMVLECVGSCGRSLHARGDTNPVKHALSVISALHSIEIPKKCSEALQKAVQQILNLDRGVAASGSAGVAALCVSDGKWIAALAELTSGQDLMIYCTSQFLTAVVAEVLSQNLIREVAPSAHPIWIQTLQHGKSQDHELYQRAIQQFETCQKSRSQRNYFLLFMVILIFAFAVSAFSMPQLQQN